MRPARRYGKSTRSTGNGATAFSMATSDGCVRLLPAPGVSNSAPAAPSGAEEDAAGLGELGDALGGADRLGAVVGVGLAQALAEAALHLPLGRALVAALPVTASSSNPRSSSAHVRGSTNAAIDSDWAPLRPASNVISSGPISPRQRNPVRMASNTAGRADAGSCPAAYAAARIICSGDPLPSKS